jgi:hypothetical protein
MRRFDRALGSISVTIAALPKTVTDLMTLAVPALADKQPLWTPTQIRCGICCLAAGASRSQEAANWLAKYRR